MTDHPIDLDGHRTVAERRLSEMRRRPANDRMLAAPSVETRVASLEKQMLAEPARTCLEVMERWRFLLYRYLASSGGKDERTQELIVRAIDDMERIRRSEEQE